jgi:hypothetical protein
LPSPLKRTAATLHWLRWHADQEDRDAPAQARELSSDQPHFFVVLNRDPLGQDLLLLTVFTSKIEKVRLRGYHPDLPAPLLERLRAAALAGPPPRPLLNSRGDTPCFRRNQAEKWGNDEKPKFLAISLAPRVDSPSAVRACWCRRRSKYPRELTPNCRRKSRFNWLTLRPTERASVVSFTGEANG